jgi:DNA helicase HerA-like ATPase
VNKGEPIQPSNHLERLFLDAKKLGVLRSPQNAALAGFVAEDPNDTELIELLEEEVNIQKALAVVDPDPFRATNPLNETDLQGSIGLGFILPERIPWRIYPEMLTNHMLILGRSGGGKTNLIFLILLQLLEARNR